MAHSDPHPSRQVATGHCLDCTKDILYSPLLTGSYIFYGEALALRQSGIGKMPLFISESFPGRRGNINLPYNMVLPQAPSLKEK